MARKDQSPEYWADLARMSFEDDLSRLMDREKMSRAALARAIGSKPEYISKILNGEKANYTLKTLAKLGRAVRGVLEVRLINEDDEVVRILTLDEAEALESSREQRHPSDQGAATTSFDNVVSLAEYVAVRAGEPPPQTEASAATQTRGRARWQS